VEFDKVRRSALRQVHLNPAEACLLRLAAQPDGVRLGLFREQQGITEARASQIARALEATHLVKRSRDASNPRARIVRATDKGCRTLAKFDAQFAETLGAELATGEASPLQAAIAAVQLAAAPPAPAAEGREDRKLSRAEESAKRDRLCLWDALDDAQRS
jgi:DNA-binding MarR family transcriptional regulator